MTRPHTLEPDARVDATAFDDGSSFEWFADDGSSGSSNAANTGGELCHVCVFELGGVTYGLDVAVVSEVFTPDTLTPIPLAPEGFLGLCNLRGSALPIADFGAILRTTDPASHRFAGDRQVLVLRFPSIAVGVTIDRVVEIRGYRAGEVVPAQTNQTDDPVRGYLQGEGTRERTTMLRSDFVRARLEAMRLRRDRDLSAADYSPR